MNRHAIPIGLTPLLILVSVGSIAVACPPPPDCGPCEHWNGYSCVWNCTYGQICCDGTCVTGNCCDDDDCDECCIYHQCGSSCGYDCCRASAYEYCCGSGGYPGSTCCDYDEVCCYNPETYLYSCSQPCEVTVVDSTSCAESKEEDYECLGCITFPSIKLCADYTYRDYTGLIIKGCDYGCRYAGNAALRLSQLLYAKGQWVESAKYMEWLLQRQPPGSQEDVLGALFHLAIVYQRMGEVSAAAQTRRRFAEVANPGDPRIEILNRRMQEEVQR